MPCFSKNGQAACQIIEYKFEYSETKVQKCGYKSCFFRIVEGDDLKVVEKRIFDPKEKYGEQK